MGGDTRALFLIAVVVGAVAGCAKSPSGGTAGMHLWHRLQCWVLPSPSPFTATVSKERATFIFPTGDYRDTWEWNVDGPPPVVNGNRIIRNDYDWTVHAPGDFYFGYEHYEYGTLQQGSFASLLDGGDVVGYHVVSTTPFRTEKLPGPVNVEQLPCGNVAVTLDGNVNVTTVFAGRPASVQFTVPQRSFGIFKTIYGYKEVTVKYTD